MKIGRANLKCGTGEHEVGLLITGTMWTPVTQTEGVEFADPSAVLKDEDRLVATCPALIGSGDPDDFRCGEPMVGYMPELVEEIDPDLPKIWIALLNDHGQAFEYPDLPDMADASRVEQWLSS